MASISENIHVFKLIILNVSLVFRDMLIPQSNRSQMCSPSSCLRTVPLSDRCCSSSSVSANRTFDGIDDARVVMEVIGKYDIMEAVLSCAGNMLKILESHDIYSLQVKISAWRCELWLLIHSLRYICM